VSSEDFEEPLTPSHLLCGRQLMSLPDTEQSDTDVQPKDLNKRMHQLKNVINHGRDGGASICWSYGTPIVMLPREPQTESCPLEMWLSFMMKISQEESGGLERLKVLSQDLMAVSEELLFELKAREEEPLRSDVQCSAFTPWRSSARMMSRKLQGVPEGQILSPPPVVFELSNLLSQHVTAQEGSCCRSGPEEKNMAGESKLRST